MKKTILFSLSIFLLLFTKTYSTTWDEPWQDEIIKKAEYFVMAKVINNDYEKGTTIKILKNIYGKELSGEILISDFYLLHICSSSDGHGPEFQFDKDEKYYFFLAMNEDGKYCISTPSSGFAYINQDENKVFATYRHSYHQTLIDPETYETTMTILFRYYHNESYETQFITDFANQFLNKSPAGFEEPEIDDFFAQHVAMECIYHLRIDGFYEELLPFLHDTSNFHNQISAARALVAYNSKECKNELFAAISNPDYDDFVKVMCIYTLTEFNPIEHKNEIKELIKNASDEFNGFGGNIMDPRVCTYIPTVKEALNSLLDTL